MKVMFYETMNGLVRVSLEEHKDMILLNDVDIEKKTAYWALALRVENYCNREDLKVSWVKTKFVVAKKDIELVINAINSDIKASQRPFNTLSAKVKEDKIQIKVTDILPERYDFLFYFDSPISSKLVPLSLAKYKDGAWYKINEKTLLKELNPSRYATEKDFPYITEKPKLRPESSKQSNSPVKAFYIYKSDAAARVTSTEDFKAELLGVFSLPKDKKAKDITTEIITLRDIQPLTEKAQKIMKEYYKEKYYEII